MARMIRSVGGRSENMASCFCERACRPSERDVSRRDAPGMSILTLAGLMGLAVFALASGNARAGECAGGDDGGNVTSLACGDGPDASYDAFTYSAYATAIGSHARADGVESSALGYRSNSGTGGQNTAMGAFAKAGDLDETTDFNSSGTTAIGTGAKAGAVANDQNEATALGHLAEANAAFATTLGAQSKANYTGSMAIGHGVETTRDNQVKVGNVNNTYTLAGVTSDASKAAQDLNPVDPVFLVTTDAAGNLAASTFDVAALEDLPEKVADHEIRIASNTNNINALNTTVGGHTTELADHEDRIASNTNAIATHTTQLLDLHTRVIDNTSNIAALDGRVGALESGFQNLGGEISETRTEARAGTALALATAGLRYDDRPGKLSLAGGFGHFKGQSGLALGLGYNTSEEFRMNAAVSATTGRG
ncbi:hypothetical protein EN942_13020, partial [Mesorhizobium sp. M7A.F.Ca.CA.001.14.1.1]